MSKKIKCQACKGGIEATLKWQAEASKKFGWYAHFVCDMDNGLSNMHTHGLTEKYGHPDLQIVVPLSPECGHGIFWNVVRRIEVGEKFEPGTRYDGILQNMKVMFTPARECGRALLRIVLPDKHGNLTEEEMEDHWKLQWTLLDVDEYKGE